jgi:hypothetical protein
MEAIILSFMAVACEAPDEGVFLDRELVFRPAARMENLVKPLYLAPPQPVFSGRSRIPDILRV